MIKRNTIHEIVKNRKNRNVPKFGTFFICKKGGR